MSLAGLKYQATSFGTAPQETKSGSYVCHGTANGFRVGIQDQDSRGVRPGQDQEEAFGAGSPEVRAIHASERRPSDDEGG